MIKLYGSPMSSAHRCYWALEEMQVAYERVPLDMRKGEHKTPNFLKLNPNGKIPCIIDGDFILWESVAINHYLALKHKPALLGKTVAEQGQVMQWSLWAMGELQPPLVNMLIQKFFVPDDKKNPKVNEEALVKLSPLYDILDQHLKNKNYLASSEFTLADLAAASVVRINPMIGVSLDAYPNIQKWLAAICERPAYQKVEKLGM